MYSHALGELAESKIAVVEAMAKMQARMYRKTAAVMHPPKDEQRPWEYQCQWCRVRPTIKHQHDPVGYMLASLLNSYERDRIVSVHDIALTNSAVRTAVLLPCESEFGKGATSPCMTFTYVL